MRPISVNDLIKFSNHNEVPIGLNKSSIMGKRVSNMVQ